jgi:hypothetical protein
MKSHAIHSIADGSQGRNYTSVDKGKNETAGPKKSTSILPKQNPKQSDRTNERNSDPKEE